MRIVSDRPTKTIWRSVGTAFRKREAASAFDLCKTGEKGRARTKLKTLAYAVVVCSSSEGAKRNTADAGRTAQVATIGNRNE